MVYSGQATIEFLEERGWEYLSSSAWGKGWRYYCVVQCVSDELTLLETERSSARKQLRVSLSRYSLPSNCTSEKEEEGSVCRDVLNAKRQRDGVRYRARKPVDGTTGVEVFGSARTSINPVPTPTDAS